MFKVHFIYTESYIRFFKDHSSLYTAGSVKRAVVYKELVFKSLLAACNKD